MKAATKMDTCIICRRKVQPAENWMRCHLWGGFTSFRWKSFGECLRSDSEQKVESVVWRASTNAQGEQ
jgi:hypothetical protein